MEKSAVISACGQYRYRLSRIWEPEEKNNVVWLMLNPSKADAEKDDPTIRKCITISKHSGYSGMHVLNLFAFRATNPKQLKLVDDPIGPENNLTILHCAKTLPIICAWGANGCLYGRNKEVLRMIKKCLPDLQLFCLRKTKKGMPYHPLYLPNDCKTMEM